MGRLLFGSLLLTVGLAPCYADLYNQPATFPGGIASQQCDNCFGNGGINFVAFDDFTLASDSTIRSLTWQGAYGAASSNPITGFTVAFWQNAGGLPGTLLQSYNISGNAGEKFVATGINGFLDYSYGANLATPFTAAANTTYWLSVQPKLQFPPQWYWRAGEGGDGVSAFLDANTSTTPVIVPEDSAFSLSSNAQTPEPSAMGVAGAILAILGFIRWRRRSQVS
jgi:hypothetical protein